MKRFLAIVLSAILLLPISACGGNSTDNPINSGSEATSGNEVDPNALSYDLEDGTHIVKNSDGTVVFTLMPDCHIGHHKRNTRSMERVIEWSNANKVDFTVYLGDNINTGYRPGDKTTVAEVAEFFDSTKLHTSPFYVIKGNHDPSITEFETNTLIMCGDVAFIGFFAKYYQVDPENARLNNGLVEPGTLKWIETVMEKCKGKRIILGCHFSIVENDSNFLAPIRSAGAVPAMNKDYVDFGREKILELADKYNVELYFSGHEHNGENPSGTAGSLTNWSLSSIANNEIFTVVRVTSDKATIEFRDVNESGKIIRTDEYTFQKTVK